MSEAISDPDKFLNETFSAIANISTGGLVGFGKEGFKPGVFGKPLVKGTKEITGAAAAEDANELAREQFEKDTARIREERKTAQAQTERRSISASRGAAGARGRTQSSSLTGASGSGSNSNNQTDFLGL